MKIKRITTALGYICFMALFLLIYLGCSASPAYLARKNPQHLTHFPPQKAMAIDGIWKDPYGYRVIFDCGRGYLTGNKVMEGGMVFKDVVRVAPGKYRAKYGECWTSPVPFPWWPKTN